MKASNSKNFSRWVGKFILAGIISFCLVSVFSFFFYNPPIHVPCDDGATDYKREESVFWSRAAEGFCLGRTDSNGYNNFSVPENIDIIYLGSSQSEGLYVNTDQTYPHLLNGLFESSGIKLTGYNLAMSAHSFKRNIINLPAVLEKYRPRYVVFETQDLAFSQEQIDEAFSGEHEALKSYTKRDPLYWIQKNPYVKLVYLQLKNFLAKSDEEEDIASAMPSAFRPEDNHVNVLIEYLSDLAEEYDFTPIVFYLPEVSVDPDCENICKENTFFEHFADLCEQYDIRLVDMAEAFNRSYRESYTVPTGFPNTATGYGHINKYGHRIIAESLYPVLKECEEEANR